MPAIPRWSARWASCRTARSRWSRPSRTPRRFEPRDAEQPRLRDADDAVGRRHRRHRRRAASGASRTSSGRTRKTSATPPPTARRRSSASRRWSTRWSWSARRTRPTRSGCRRSRERAGCPRAVLVQRAARDRLGALRRRHAGSASPPAPRRPRCWSRRSLDAFAERYALTRRDRRRRRGGRRSSALPPRAPPVTARRPS